MYVCRYLYFILTWQADAETKLFTSTPAQRHSSCTWYQGGGKQAGRLVDM